MPYSKSYNRDKRVQILSRGVCGGRIKGKRLWSIRRGPGESVVHGPRTSSLRHCMSGNKGDIQKEFVYKAQYWDIIKVTCYHVWQQYSPMGSFPVLTSLACTVFIPLAAQGAYQSHFRWALIKTLISWFFSLKLVIFEKKNQWKII